MYTVFNGDGWVMGSFIKLADAEQELYLLYLDHVKQHGYEVLYSKDELELDDTFGWIDETSVDISQFDEEESKELLEWVDAKMRRRRYT